jgi:hypothetical protein
VLLVLAMIMSVLWGLRAINPKHPRWEIFNNFTVNFVGSFAGWCCVYAVAARALSAFPDLRALNGIDALLFFLSILGIIGMLPQAILGVVSSLRALTVAVSKKLGGD